MKIITAILFVIFLSLLNVCGRWLYTRIHDKEGSTLDHMSYGSIIILLCLVWFYVIMFNVSLIMRFL